jgi:hypothetical protein
VTETLNGTWCAVYTLGHVGPVSGVILLIGTTVLVGFTVVAGMLARSIRLSSEIVGSRGVVTAAVPLGGYGEIRARVAGRSLRLSARAERPLALGAHVVVISRLGEGTVLVAPQHG